ncbi:hypothetical protein Z043_125771, partial [Scleropages formosus]
VPAAGSSEWWRRFRPSSSALTTSPLYRRSPTRRTDSCPAGPPAPPPGRTRGAPREGETRAVPAAGAPSRSAERLAETRADCCPPTAAGPSPEEEVQCAAPVAEGLHCSPAKSPDRMNKNGKLIPC